MALIGHFQCMLCNEWRNGEPVVLVAGDTLICLKCSTELTDLDIVRRDCEDLAVPDPEC